MIDATKAERVLVEANPIPSTFESIQAYVACATHGLLISAIAPEESGHILHAAQVALGVLNFSPKSRKLASS
jgi:hypothetical protein